MKKVFGDFLFEWLPDGVNMRLINDLKYKTPNVGYITVPKNFITDGSSIPRILWSVAKSPFVGKHKFAAVLHDYLYKCGLSCKKLGINCLYCKRLSIKGLSSRKEADDLFYYFMRVAGVGRIEAKTKYWAVRLFGKRW